MNDIWPQLIPSILTILIGGGGVLGAKAIWRKMRPEEDRLIVAAAKEAVELILTTAKQKAEDLKESIERVEALEDRASSNRAEIDNLKHQCRTHTQALESAKEDIGRLKLSYQECKKEHRECRQTDNEQKLKLEQLAEIVRLRKVERPEPEA